MMKKTIPEARNLLVKLTQAIGQDHGGAIQVPEDIVPTILELDDILRKVYDDLSDFLKPQSKTEADHRIAKILDMCCCLQWRARRIRGMGDFCPDCVEHGESVGMNSGEIKIIRPPKSVWRKKRV